MKGVPGSRVAEIERRQTNHYGKAIQQHAVYAGEADCRPIKDF